MTDHGESPRPSLLGVGVGPGESDLVTLKAMKALRRSDVIFVPETEARSQSVGRAEVIVREVVPEVADRIRRIPFAMSERRGVGEKRASAWQVSARAALDAFAEGATTLAFATIGDPSVYSTFSYLCDLVSAERDVDIEVIPGITAMQALAAATRIPLCEGQEVLALVPATVGAERVAEIAGVVDSLTIYKSGRQFSEIKQALAETGRLERAVIGTNVGLDEQRLLPVSDLDEATVPYFSSILSAPERTTTGGKL